MEDNSGEGPRPLKVTFSGPAKHWTDAIPIANGRLGAMIWGGVAVVDSDRFPAAIAEMLVESTAEDLHLLPALPQDKWADGCVKD
uniref:Glycosyl hydrolase family 95 N-terminal domain-containing protein n=1 Tax=Populus trichocarpa TaxID=3694 RepID=A0A2K1Z5C6_POPTR